jgi:hypothetical protein
MSRLNTPILLDEEYYEDQFTNHTNWELGEFEQFCAVIGFEDDPEAFFFCHRASACWAAMTDEQKTDFACRFNSGAYK